MAQKPLAGWRVRLIFTGTHHHMIAQRKGAGMDGFGGVCCCTVCMHPNMTKIMTEAGFEEAAGGGIKRLAAAFHAADPGFKAWVGCGRFAGL